MKQLQINTDKLTSEISVKKIIIKECSKNEEYGHCKNCIQHANKYIICITKSAATLFNLNKSKKATCKIFIL